MANQRNLLQDILVVIFIAIMFFNAAFLYLAYKEGFFHIIVGSDKVEKPITLESINEMLELIKKERQALEQKKQEMEKQAAEIEQRKEQINLEHDVVTKQKEEISLKMEKISRLLKERDNDLGKEQQENITKLAKMYDVMKPAKVADIFSKMDDQTVVIILKKMKLKVSAKVLANMDATRAAMFTEMMQTDKK